MTPKSQATKEEREEVLSWCVDAAGSMGFEVTEKFDSDFVRLRHGDGRTFVTAAAVFAAPIEIDRDTAAVARLVQALSAVIRDTKYILHLRRPVPKGFNPEPVARATQMWLSARERGEGVWRNALYEDAQVSVEISLTDLPAEPDSETLMFIARRSLSSLSLNTLENKLIALAEKNALIDHEEPFVLAVGSSNPWNITRGFLRHWLYGVPLEAKTNREAAGQTFDALHEPTGLFATPIGSRISGLWWRSGAEGKEGYETGWAQENPWNSFVGDMPSFSGPRYGVAKMNAKRGLAFTAVAMRWFSV